MAIGNRFVDDGLVGESLAIRRVRALIAKVAPTHLPVLIQGPTGSGKELVARALHRVSGRPGALVAFNIAAVAETLFEDALFGHVRGAFSGAVSDRAGYLAEANGGTVFLDEIGGLPLGMQAKLLRAIETQEFRPVGARQDRRSDFRVVAATNEDVAALVADGRFRADLMHRIGAIVIRVPPLRERREDIPTLVQHFATQVATSLPVAPTFTDAALRALQARDWPGNVRELKHAVERVCVLGETSVVTVEDLRTLLDVADGPPKNAEVRGAQHLALLAALEAAGWDTRRAAQLLGVDRVTVYRRMRRFGIAPPRRSERARATRDGCA